MRQKNLFTPVKPELRPYQEEALTELRKLISEGVLRVCMVAPTGSGKTVIAAAIIDMARKLNKRILFVAHRIELINQTAKQLARFGVTDIGIIRSQDQRTDESAPVQIASIDTLRNRVLPASDIIFIDECHRSMAESYLRLFNELPNSLHVGLTATPFRTDNQGLGEIYKGLVVCAKPSQLIEDKFIVSPRIFCAPELPDLSEVEVVYGTHDYHNLNLSNAMSTPKIVGNMVEEWKKHAKGRRTVVFAVNVDHSKKIVEEFRNAGVSAAHLDGSTSLSERETILLKLEKYELQLVSNCDVLTEGWDQPNVKCAVLARPTQSTRLHLQQCGRILRTVISDPIGDLHELPREALILDHSGNCLRHGLPQQDRIYDLGTGQSRKEKAPTLHVCKECFTIWGGTSRKCPECSVEMEVKTRAELDVDPHVQLQEVQAHVIMTEEDQQRQFFLKQLTICRDLGKKPGAAAYKFKEKYSKWPPYSWSQQAKEHFESNKEWRDAVDKRTAVREHWKARSFIPEAAEPTGGGPDEGFTEEPEEDYWGQFKIDPEEIPF